jgi:phage terminase small subunit
MAAKKRKPAAFKPGGKRPKLTERQRRFVEQYLVEPNATAAARAAGYAHPEQAGYALLRNIQVSRAIEAVTGEATRAAIACRDERLEILTTIVRGECAGAKPKDRINAANVMSRMNGEQVFNAQLSGPGGGPIQAQLSALSTEELVALLEKTHDP